MDRWQGSVGRSCGQDYGRDAGGVSTCDRRQAHNYSSHRSEDSTRHRNVGGIGSFSKCNRQKTDIEHDEIAATLINGLSSSNTKKLPMLKTAQMKGIRAFLNSLEASEGSRKLFYSRPYSIFRRRSGYA